MGGTGLEPVTPSLSTWPSEMSRNSPGVDGAQDGAPGVHVPRSLPSKAYTARKNARKRVSPYGAFRCRSLQSRFARDAASFRLLQLATARVAGLLIPRSRVRIPPGP